MAGLSDAVVADSANIARHLPLRAARHPDQPAVKIPRGRNSAGAIDFFSLSFRELDGEVGAWVGRLRQAGVKPGDRVLVMVRQGLPLIASVFALFTLGAVPVIIDPGMGRKSFLGCVARTQPRVLLGIPRAQLASHLFRTAFASVELRVWASGSPTHRLSSVSQSSSLNVQQVATSATDLAAILFTSGSTGAPKGVCYEHGMFEAQARLVRETYAIQPGEIDLPMLPIFALFGPALGLTTVVPELDPSRPASLDPARIVQAILQERVTNSFGSPTLWRKIFDHCLDHKIALPSLRRVLCAGAAVPASLWADASRVLPNGKLHSPYGATEALPVATVASDGIELRPDFGALLGRTVPETRARVIAIEERPIVNLTDTREMPAEIPGEIIVAGPTVTKAYDHSPEATARAKIAEPQPGGVAAVIWHRTGDAGCFDLTGRLWFSGRIAERVETSTGVLYTEPCEQVFRSHAQVVRCALVGLGPRPQQEPALVVQPRKPASDLPGLAQTLRELAASYPQTAAITKFFFHPDFPVDVRHNAKIHRLALARWAATARAYEPDRPA